MASGFKKGIFFILLVGLTSLAYAYMIKPANERFRRQRARVQSKLNRFRELEKAQEDARDLDKQLEQLQEAIELFEGKLPPQSQVHKVLEHVAIIAQKQGLKTKAIRTMKQKDCNGYIEQPLKMQLYGDFYAYYAFLLELERLPRITKVRELELKKDPKDEGIVTAEFVVSIFFQNKTD